MNEKIIIVKPSLKEIKEEMFQIEKNNNINCMDLKNHTYGNFSKATLMTKPDGLWSCCESCANKKIKEIFELKLRYYNQNQILNKLNDEKYKNPFQEHLDECKQCKEQPFNLCDEGNIIMKYSMYVLQQEEIKI